MTTGPTPIPLPTVDPAASTADKVVTTILEDAESPIETAIIAANPVMGTPLLKQLWEGAFSWCVNQLAGALGLLTGYALIDIQKLIALTDASNALVQLQAAQKSGNQNAIAAANANMDAAVTPVLHFVGSVSPSP